MKVKIQQEDKFVEYEVALCDTHGETTTPKDVKDKVKIRLEEYEELRRKMAEFGITESVPTKRKIDLGDDEPVQIKQSQRPILKPNVGARKIVDVAPKILENEMGSEVNNAINVDRTLQTLVESGKAKGKINKDFKLEVENIELQHPQNIPVPIPKRISHNDGTSLDINIVQTSDKALQDKAKEIDRLTKSGHADPNRYYGYQKEVTCTMCGGSGKARAGGQTCPKCKGRGILD